VFSLIIFNWLDHKDI